ncbi:MAG: SGNH/GDSL hydrolase family protein [Acidimicrobiales bacterium]
MTTALPIPKRWIALVCIVVASMSVAGCSSASADTNSSRSSTAPPVGVVGDSITYLSRAAIAHAISAWPYRIEAVEGKTIADMTPLLESKIMKGSDGSPHSLFINLGTNDVVHRNRNWLTSWNTLMADTSHVPCEVLFTINQFADAYSRPGDPKAEAINRAIVGAHEADPSRVHIIDWNAAVLANHHAITAAQAAGTKLPAPLIRRDGIHPTPQGGLWIARHIRSELNGVCRP